MTPVAVVIGRNEGARLIACLSALRDQVAQVIYVDSGSTDGSVEAAEGLGATVIRLNMEYGLTAARARNAGLAALSDDIELVQFLDGDCVLREGWIAQAKAFLDTHLDVAVVCGRRRERHPEASIFNALIDREWDTPLGDALACGGDALMRVQPLRDVGGYRDTLIAGEEPELCVRLRKAGWKIWRLGAEMTWHDAQVTQVSQWWRRSQRAGHAFAEGAYLHGKLPERHWVGETRRALLWGAMLPLVIVILAMMVGPIAMLLLAIYPLQVARLALRSHLSWAFFTTLGKFPQAIGALKFYVAHFRGRKTQIIEYK